MVKFLITAGVIIFLAILFFGFLFYLVRDDNKVAKTKREKALEDSAYDARKIFLKLTSNSINNPNIVSDEMRVSIEQWIKEHQEIR